VNNDGWIEVARAPTLLRTLLDGTEISEGLQLQTNQQISMKHRHQKKHEHKFRPNPIQSPWALKKEE